MITVFKNAIDTKNPHFITVDKMLERIKSCKIQKQIDKIRQETNEKKKKELKKQLPSICFSGQFSEREDKFIISHSGFAILDFDHLDNVAEEKEKFKQHPFVYAAFISPSGDGLKVLVKIPADKERHKGHYLALVKLFPTLDPTSINLSRVCFESIDPDIYINTLAIEFVDFVDQKDYQKERPLGNLAATHTNYTKADIPLNMIRKALGGEKHAVLLKASKLMGGYIAGGLVEENEGIRLLESEIQKKEIDDFDGAKKTIKDGVAHGKLSPLSELEESIIVNTKSTGILKADDIWEKMKHGFKNGKERGKTTHFSSFDENFKWKKGEITLIIGRPNSGKTEFMLQLMLLKSFYDGWKWGVFSPENYPADEFYDSLIHSYIGQTTDPFYKNYQMSLEEYEKGYLFVRKHFFYVYPDTLHTIEEIGSNFMYLVEHESINGTFIDPFNQLFIENYSKRDDQYLSVFLTERKKVAVKYELCDVISSHPKSMFKNKDGEYDVPDIYDIAGGAMWSNKVDNIISVHRPKYIQDPKDTTVEIHVKKIKKQKLVGVPGMSIFDFNRSQARYYQNGETPFQKKNIIPSGPTYNPDRNIEPEREFMEEKIPF